MLTKDFLEEAIRLTSNDRNKDYGDILETHENIAALWSAFLRKTITAHDVAVCMALVKVARLMHQHKKDSYIDMAAYAAIAGEIEARTGKDQSFESEGERRGRITKAHIKSLNKKNTPSEEMQDELDKEKAVEEEEYRRIKANKTVPTLAIPY